MPFELSRHVRQWKAASSCVVGEHPHGGNGREEYRNTTEKVHSVRKSMPSEVLDGAGGSREH